MKNELKKLICLTVLGLILTSCQYGKKSSTSSKTQNPVNEYDNPAPTPEINQDPPMNENNNIDPPTTPEPIIPNFSNGNLFYTSHND